jgi:HAD superfamily hydrolase (TIGR01509 family)
LLRGFVFDFDGLILDTEVPAFESWREVYASFGATLPLEHWAKAIGSGQGDQVFDPYAYLEEQIGRSIDRAAVRLDYRARKDERLRREPARPGVAAFLAKARSLDLRLGIASSSPHAWIDGHLQRLGLTGEFEAVRCFEDVTRTKPDPDLFLAALDALGLSPAEAIAFEDSPNGILAAKRAGMFCVAVPNPVTGQLDLGRADLLVDSFERLDPVELGALVG